MMIFLQSSYYNTVKSEYFRVFHGYIGREEDILLWTVEKYSECGGNFKGYAQQFAVLTNVTIRNGSLQFYLPCYVGDFSHLRYSFRYGKEGTHLNNWMENVFSIGSGAQTFEIGQKKKQEGTKFEKLSQSHKLVIAVQRYEYANLYHTMTDWYNVFLVATLLNVSTDDVHILLIGNNIHGPLDPIWQTLFDAIFYTGEIQSSVVIPKLAWNILGYESPMNYRSRQSLPFVEQFKEFFLRRHGIVSTKQLNCKKLSIVFLLRRDYVTHAGNKQGKVSRKIKNEDELLNIMKKDFPTADVKGLQFDQYSFKEQLDFAANADLFISMHGAGLAHVLFLPSHAGVLELFPLYKLKVFGVMYFQAMARWRKLKYESWQNLNPNNEYPDAFTYVPPRIIQNSLKKWYSQACG